MKQDGWDTLGKAAAFITAAILIYLLNGWALSLLWGWFLVPLGVESISTAQAIGIMMVVYLLRGHSKPENQTAMEIAKTFASVSLFILMTLGIGFIVHLFV